MACACVQAVHARGEFVTGRSHVWLSSGIWLAKIQPDRCQRSPQQLMCPIRFAHISFVCVIFVLSAWFCLAEGQLDRCQQPPPPAAGAPNTCNKSRGLRVLSAGIWVATLLRDERQPSPQHLYFDMSPEFGVCFSQLQGSGWQKANLIGANGPLSSWCAQYEWSCSKGNCADGNACSASPAVQLAEGQPLLLAA
jgi:hypothetical protein